MNQSSNTKTKVYIAYICYVCEDRQKYACNTIRHVRVKHYYEIPSRQNGLNRPRSDVFQYVNSREKEHDTERYGCPSCWFHCHRDDLEELYIHTVNTHNPISVLNYANSGGMTDEDDHDEESPALDARSNLGSAHKNESYQHDEIISGNTTRGNNSTPLESIYIPDVVFRTETSGDEQNPIAIDDSDDDDTFSDEMKANFGNPAEEIQKPDANNISKSASSPSNKKLISHKIYKAIIGVVQSLFFTTFVMTIVYLKLVKCITNNH